VSSTKASAKDGVFVVKTSVLTCGAFKRCFRKPSKAYLVLSEIQLSSYNPFVLGSIRTISSLVLIFVLPKLKFPELVFCLV